jgi:hypothetical protein
MQRNFEPIHRQVENWQAHQLSAEAAKLIIYLASIEGDLEVPRYLARTVHDLYFNPKHEEFTPRTMWSLSNAFTTAFKEFDPIRFRNSRLRPSWAHSGRNGVAESVNDLSFLEGRSSFKCFSAPNP